ncbi:MAG TPA: hypothetical protein PKE69_28280, partial [Pyrinomonadaceae bacterium]|nr:hypothetical protein [Pyrinomonadaceae bacterium]
GCFLLSLLLTFKISTLPTHVVEGEIANRTLIADQSYEIYDAQATQVLVDQAVASVKPVYEYDEQLSRTIDQRVKEAFEKTRQQIFEAVDLTDQQKREFFEKNSGIPFSDDEIDFLIAVKFKPEIEIFLRELIQEATASYIVDNASAVKSYSNLGIIVRPKQGSEEEKAQAETVVTSLKNIRDLKKVQSELIELAQQKVKQTSAHDFNVETLAHLAIRFLQPNLVLNAQETEVRKERARQGVNKIIIRVQAGQSIIRNGEPYDHEARLTIEEAQRQRRQDNFIFKFLGTFLLVSLLVFATYYFSARYLRRFQASRLDLLFFATLLFVLIFWVRVFAALASPVRDSLNSE